MNINVVPEMQAIMVPVASIVVAKDRRDLNPSAVEKLISSIERIGLQTPITVRDLGCGEFSLIAGRHRLEACTRIGWKEIPSVVRDCDEVEAELWEIAENLHRAELTALERDEQVARWIELVEGRIEQAKSVLSQPETKLSDRGRINEGRPEGGVNAAARELGISKPDAHRAVKVASLSPEAKEAARNLQLDDNRTALLEAARQPTPAQQVATLHVRGTFGTGENEWFTPAQHLEAARAVLGEFDLDPATHPIAQKQVGAAKFFTKEDDGLAHEWHGRVWLNPPYAQPAIADFVSKMVAERRTGRVTEAIMLTHNYTDTTWFHHAASEADAICFTKGRVRFVAPDGSLAAPTQGQAFFYFGGNLQKFCDAFRTIGFVVEVKK